MSWAKDEWKQDLAPKVLQKISDLENVLENLQKVRHQQDLKMDSYTSALEKGKFVLEEERSSNAALQKEVLELTLKISTLEAKQEKYVNEIKNKENTVEFGEELLDKARQKFKAENAKSTELQKSLDQKCAEAENYAERSEKLAVEVGKLKQEKAHLNKENENFKERLSAVTKEIQTLRQTVSENEQMTMDRDQECEKDNDECCSREPVVKENRSDAFVDILKKENTSLIREMEQLRLQREQMKKIIEEKVNDVERNVAKVADIRVELQTTKKDLKDSKTKMKKLEATLESRERELSSIRDKLVKYKTNEERMNEEMKTLNDQLEEQMQSKIVQTQERSDDMKKRQDLERGSSKTPCHTEDTNDTEQVAESKIHELSRENESLREHLRWSRETNSALMDRLKEKEQTLKAFYEEQQELHKKEEKRLEKVEALLLENAEFKQKVKNLESEAKASTNGQVCTSCKQNINSNEVQIHKRIPVVDENERKQDSAVPTGLKSVTETVNMASQYREGDVAMTESMDGDDVSEKCEELQANDKSMKTDDRLNDMETLVQVRGVAQHVTHPNKNVHVDDDVISCTTSDPACGIQHKILQVLVSLSTVQREHEMVQRAVEKCYNTVNKLQQHLISQTSDTQKQPNRSMLLTNSLASQLKAVKCIAQRCTVYVKSQAESIAGYLEIRNEEITLSQDEEGNIEDVQHDKKGTRTPERDLSWDDFESEQAFQLFKSSVDPLIKQIEDQQVEEASFVDKDESLKEMTQESLVIEEQPNEDKLEMSRNSRKQGKPDIILISKAENVLQIDDLVDVLRKLMDENNELWAERLATFFEYFENNAKKNIPENRKERQQSKHDPAKKTTTTTTITPEMSSESEGEITPQNLSLKEGNLVLDELEIIKRKISAIQKPIRQLMSSIETTKHQKEKANSHINLLTSQMRNMSSHHDMRYTDLENTLKTTSERELSLQHQINNLQTEKEDIDCNFRESIDSLKQKELELVKLSQEIKNIQTKNTENELKLKNKIEALKGENTCVWTDYVEASKEAQEKNKEIESLINKMKMTEHSLLSLFNTIGNIDDFLKRAKEMNMFQ